MSWFDSADTFGWYAESKSEENPHSSTEALARNDANKKPELGIVQANAPRSDSTDPYDPTNPKSWPNKQKWTMVVIVSLFCFVPSLASTMLAPALPLMKRKLRSASDLELQAVFSIFSLGYAVGPLLMAPLSDVHGRVPILQISNIIFLVANACCIAAKTGAAMIVLRLVAGLGSSAPLALGGAMIGETFLPEKRGSAVAVYALAPIAGPTLGPIMGAFLAEHCPLAYQFVATSAASLAVALLGLAFLRETNSRVLVARQVAKEAPQAAKQAVRVNQKDSLRLALRRPLRLLFTQPMAMLLCIYQSLLWGILYLVISVFVVIFTRIYGEALDVASLHYLAMFVGSMLGTQITGLVADRIYRVLKARNGDVGNFKLRLPLLTTGTVLLAAGLVLIGSAARHRASWIVADVGSVLFSAGNVMSYQALQTLMIDSYARHAGAMMAAATLLRSISTFAFPLLAPALFRALGLGWGYVLVGLLVFGIGLMGVLSIFMLGHRLVKPLPGNF